MVSGEPVKLEEVRQKVRDALTNLKPPAYILDRGSDGYRLYSVPSRGEVGLVVEARSLGSFFSQMTRMKLDNAFREVLGSYAARLPAGKVMIIDAQTKSLTQLL